MKTIYFQEDDDIVEICKDNVFKAVFTKDMPESRIALSKLVSALIGRDITIIDILANEPPVDSTYERQIRFDINCRAENGEQLNVEMCFNPDPYEPVRMEYYTGKLFTAQGIKGIDKDFSDLLRVYQISILANKSFFPDKDFYHSFEYYDHVKGVSLNGKTQIITIELTKLDNVVDKSIEEMNTKEYWAIFFRYLTDRSKRGIINEILKREEGLAMASEVVMSISKDWEERMRIFSEEKRQLDIQSSFAHARKEGYKTGHREGHKEGHKEGHREGHREGDKERQKRTAQKMKIAGEPLSKIINFTELSPEEIEKL